MKKWHKTYVEDEEEKTHVSHSPSYHNYFQGYSEKKVLGENGKGYRIVRKYTADYLTFTEDKGRWIRFKILYTCLYLASCALTLLALFSGAQANSAGWVAVFGVLQMVMWLLMLIPMGNYVAAPMYMRMGQFNISAKRLGNYAIPATVLAAMYLLLSLIWYTVKQTAPVGKDILCLLYQLCSTAAIGALCVTEYRTKYIRIPNKNVDQSGFDANEIW